MNNYINNLNSLNNSCISNSSSTVSTTGSNSFMLNNNNNNMNVNKMFTRRLSNDINHFLVNHHEIASENNKVLIKNQQIDSSNVNNQGSLIVILFILVELINK
jgi:hypothetical protein